MDPIQIFVIVSSTLFGLIVGSFLNVVILRWNTGRTVMGRSGCLSCGSLLTAHELVPVLSYVALRGKCKNCGSRISLQYPLVEVGTALLFGMIAGAGMPVVTSAIAVGIAAFAMLMCVYDMRHTILPDQYIGAFAGASVLFRIAHEGMTWEMLHGSMVGAVLVAAPLLVLWAVSRGKWLGFGDVKLAAAMGVLLGVGGGFSALWLAYVLGALIMVSLMGAVQLVAYARAHVGIARLSRTVSPLTMKSEIAFGPFLILGCMIVWISTLYGTPFDIMTLMGGGL